MCKFCVQTYWYIATKRKPFALESTLILPLAACIIWSTKINVTPYLMYVRIHGILAYLVTNSIALFLYRCMCVTAGRGGGGVILPVVTKYTVLFTFVRSLCL